MTVVDLYTIQIVRTYNDGSHPDLAAAKASDAMAEMEENLTDLLPAGYRARIRRWDHADEPTQEDDDA